MNFKLVRMIDIYIGIPLAYLLFVFKKVSCINRKRNKPLESPRRILLVKFWGIGNVIMLLPAAYAIKQKYPKAKIDFFTLDKNEAVSLDANIFNRVYTLNQDSFIKFLFTSLKVLSSLIKKKYAIVVDFEQFARVSALFSVLIGGKATVGFNTRGQHREFLYEKAVGYDNHIHMTKSFLSLAEAIGVEKEHDIHIVKLNYGRRDFKEAEKLLSHFGFSRDDLLIMLHIGTSDNFSLRRWPLEDFSGLANRLIDNYKAKIIFTGLADEDKLVKEAITYINNKKNIIDTCGLLNFNQFVSMIKISDVVVSCDTSAVHIASCLSVPVAGLYGPNTPVLYGPWSEGSIYFYKKLNCSPCITNYNAKINNCRNQHGAGFCMKKITVDEVYRGIEENYLKPGAKFRVKNKI